MKRTERRTISVLRRGIKIRLNEARSECRLSEGKRKYNFRSITSACSHFQTSADHWRRQLLRGFVRAASHSGGPAIRSPYRRPA